MGTPLFELAYASAAIHYKEATLAVFRELSAANPNVDFDVLYRASTRGMELHISSLKFAVRIWARSITFEKAEQSLIAQFSEFPPEVCRRALNAAHADAR